MSKRKNISRMLKTNQGNDLANYLIKRSHKQLYVGIDCSNGFDIQATIVEDFLDYCILVSSLKTEDGAPRWAKWIDSVDRSFKNGFCFVGDFINEGTVEIPLGRSKLILVQASLHDDELRSGFLRQFRVIRMDPTGNLSPTHIATDDRRGGWALHIRDLTANHLKDLDVVNPSADETGKQNRFSNVEI